MKYYMSIRRKPQYIMLTAALPIQLNLSHAADYRVNTTSSNNPHSRRATCRLINWKRKRNYGHLII